MQTFLGRRHVLIYGCFMRQTQNSKNKISKFAITRFFHMFVERIVGNGNRNENFVKGAINEKDMDSFDITRATCTK